jgi:hypothetical protein
MKEVKEIIFVIDEICENYVNEKLKCRINKDEIKKEWIKMVEN